ncbi:MAG: glycerate kinase [Actinomycetota bacterium]|jgi:glycerate kinase|nr:glycerate kinase [Actinomycetota bacterium]
MMQGMPALVVVAPDGFKLTASASAITAAVAEALAGRLAVVCDQCPMSDGGEGFVDVLETLGGTVRTTSVTGPLGAPVDARWRLAGGSAVVEAAAACGLHLTGGPAGNDPEAAGTWGVGELMVHAFRAGARRVLVGVGGTATTDGGKGALGALEDAGYLEHVADPAITVEVACDVATAFLDAACVFAPQKGADGDQVARLTKRLAARAVELEQRFGVDVTALAGAGAGGGLAGALAAAGAQLRSGAAMVADAVCLDRRLAGATVVVTGEGRFDATTTAGKVVDEVLRRAKAAGVPAIVVAGSVAPDAPSLPAVQVVDLSARFGSRRAWDEPAACAAEAASDLLAERLDGER